MDKDEADFREGVKIAAEIFKQHYQHGENGAEVTYSEYKKIREWADFMDDHSLLFSHLVDEAKRDRDDWDLLIKIARERLVNGEPIAPALGRWGLEIATELIDKPKWKDSFMVRDRAIMHAMAVLIDIHEFSAGRNTDTKKVKPLEQSAADAVAEAHATHGYGPLGWRTAIGIWDKRDDRSTWGYSDYHHINPNIFGAPRPISKRV